MAIYFLLVLLSVVGLYCCWTFYQQGAYPAPLCDGQTCTTLAATPYYRLFYVPNWWLGTLFYLLVILACLVGDTLLWRLLLGGSSLSLAVSIYLVWALAYKLRVVCRACYLSHAINLALFIVLLFVAKM